jgi:CubicO group peptidase (beta-lactamase class C family)
MRIKDRAFYLLAIFFFVNCTQPEEKKVAENDEGFTLASMADAGLDSSIINKIDTAITNGTYPNIHSLLIVRNNKLLYEKYWPGKDQRWGDDLGIRTQGKDSLHDIRSISKSIVSACIGIAIQQGKIKNIDEKVFTFFPEYKKLDTGLISLLTIKHLLTMSSGLVWNEDVPYDNPENSEIRMIRSVSQVEYVLSQPMEFPPGKFGNIMEAPLNCLLLSLKKQPEKKLRSLPKNIFFIRWVLPALNG